MPEIVHSQFVRDLADAFFKRYHEPTVTDDSDGEFWIECRGATPSRFRSPLTFGITDDGVTVAFDGLTVPKLLRPPFRDAATACPEAFALFDDLLTERRVAISFWQGDECVAVEFVLRDEVQPRRAAWDGYAVRVRSWSGGYDYDSRG